MIKPMLLTMSLLCASSQMHTNLWKAICKIESSNNPKAINSNAVGIAQITPVCLQDCNRIIGYQKFSLQDRFNVEKSHQMFLIYVHHYASKPLRARQAALIWRYGPSGARKPHNGAYWNRVKAEMDTRD